MKQLADVKKANVALMESQCVLQTKSKMLLMYVLHILFRQINFGYFYLRYAVFAKGKYSVPQIEVTEIKIGFFDTFVLLIWNQFVCLLHFCFIN